MKYFFLCLALASIGVTMHAQKVGHLNYGNLLESLPQVKAADNALAAYQDSLGTALTAKQKALDEKIASSTARYNSGEMTQVEAEKINGELNASQQQLAVLQQKAESSILEMRRKKLEPIVQRVQAVVTAYAKENGFLYIFDESSGFLLFDQPSEDLTDIIRSIVAEE